MIEQGVKPLDSVDGARLLADLTGVDVVWLLGLDETGSGWRPTQPPAGPAAGPAVADTVVASAKEWETMMRRTFTPRVMEWKDGFAGLFRLDDQIGLLSRTYRDPWNLPQIG